MKGLVYDLGSRFLDAKDYFVRNVMNWEQGDGLRQHPGIATLLAGAVLIGGLVVYNAMSRLPQTTEFSIAAQTAQQVAMIDEHPDRVSQYEFDVACSALNPSNSQLRLTGSVNDLEAQLEGYSNGQLVRIGEKARSVGRFFRRMETENLLASGESPPVSELISTYMQHNS